MTLIVVTSRVTHLSQTSRDKIFRGIDNCITSVYRDIAMSILYMSDRYNYWLIFLFQYGAPSANVHISERSGR
jgi:hypothetical protein